MNEFIKVPELSGKEKAAILLTELGSFNTGKVFSLLSEKEIEKLLAAVASLRKVTMQDEIRVLTEVNEFGVKKGIAKPIRSDAEIRAEMNEQILNGKDKNKDLRDFINQNPDTIANALRDWMREE
ncbi:MAG: hypothetical protein IJ717_13490 [Treponema sp.]|nr:hypothetical protein [Treponema sp.]MBR1616424.1 hypothetical protein [Treponema sp.]MBR1715934.1 hypothetical protein [Treponema sp.]